MTDGFGPTHPACLKLERHADNACPAIWVFVYSSFRIYFLNIYFQIERWEDARREDKWHAVKSTYFRPSEEVRRIFNILFFTYILQEDDDDE